MHVHVHVHCTFSSLQTLPLPGDPFPPYRPFPSLQTLPLPTDPSSPCSSFPSLRTLPLPADPSPPPPPQLLSSPTCTYSIYVPCSGILPSTCRNRLIRSNRKERSRCCLKESYQTNMRHTHKQVHTRQVECTCVHVCKRRCIHVY